MVRRLVNQLNKIEDILIKDDMFIRLIRNPPEKELGREVTEPNVDDLVIDSEDYWDLVEERFRRGNKRTDIENDSIILVYMYEGRKRSVWGNRFLANQEVRFIILIHEDYEADGRIALISECIEQLVHGKQIGYGSMRLVGKNPYEAPRGYRKQEDVYEFTTREGGCC